MLCSDLMDTVKKKASSSKILSKNILTYFTYYVGITVSYLLSLLTYYVGTTVSYKKGTIQARIFRCPEIHKKYTVINKFIVTVLAMVP